MSRKFIYIIFSVVLFSCYSKDKVPSDVIQPKKMKSVLWDIMRAQTLANEIARKDSTINAASETKILSQKVFKIHQTDSVNFNKSYNWYVKHPDVLKIIFDSLYVQKQRENDTLVRKRNHGQKFLEK